MLEVLGTLEHSLEFQQTNIKNRRNFYKKGSGSDRKAPDWSLWPRWRRVIGRFPNRVRGCGLLPLHSSVAHDVVDVTLKMETKFRDSRTTTPRMHLTSRRRSYRFSSQTTGAAVRSRSGPDCTGLRRQTDTHTLTRFHGNSSQRL